MAGNNGVDIPLPDILGEREGGRQISISEAMAAHPDLEAEFERSQDVFLALKRAMDDVQSAEKSGLSAPGLLERMASAQLGLVRQLDRLYGMLSQEVDGIRLQIVTAVYSDLLDPWRTMVLQGAFERACLLEPSRPHERILKETSILLEKARAARRP